MSKSETYSQLTKQIHALIRDESDLIANMANISAILFEQLSEVNWAGFYRVINTELVLGPFQGKVACIRIPIGTGVCGTAVKTKQTQRVADVHDFSGHIACDATSNAEIVIPILKAGEVVAVLDIDSVVVNRFDAQDQQGLETLVTLLEQTFTMPSNQPL